MRWFHRDQAASSSPAPSFSLGQSPALHTLPSPSAHTRNTSSTLDHAAPRSRHSLDSFMDDNDNDAGSGPSHDHDHLTPQSLHIAPNLSALLEEDDRRRREEMGESASNAFDPSFSQSILGPFSDSSFSEPVQVGLPPPPRGPKKPVKPKQLPVGRSTSVSSTRIGVGSGPHRSLLTSAERAGRGTGSSTTSSHSETNTMSNSESQASSKETELHSHAEQELLPAIRPTVDLGKTTPSPGMSTTLPPLQRRPLLTRPQHGHSDSIELSSPSFSSASTHEPASTVNDPRISISSTIYPASYLYPDQTDSSSRVERENSVHSSSSGHQRHGTQDSDSKISVSEGFPSYSPRDVGTPISVKDSPRGSPYAGPSPTASLPRLDFGTISPSPVSPYDAGKDSATTRSGGGSNSSVHTDSLRSRSGKPPLPTTPKPKFGRSISAHSSPRSSKSASSSPTGSPKLASLIPYSLLTTFTKDEVPYRDNLPPTTNELNAQERAELIRKNRKLTQMLGQLPSAAAVASVGPESPSSPGCFPPMPTLPSKKAHLRGASLVSDFGVLSTSLSIRDRTWRSTLSSRGSADSSRVNSPLSPMTFRERDDGVGPTPISAVTGVFPERPSNFARGLGPGPSSASSPMFSAGLYSDPDSEEEGDVTAAPTFRTLGTGHRAPLSQLHFPSTPSLTDSLYGPSYRDDMDVSSDAVKRRKREKLAKLHRYLGSPVPPELAVGIDHRAPPLPAIAPLPDDLAAFSDSEWASTKKKNSSGWKPRRRRSSSSAAFPPSWSVVADRIKEDLNEQEKAVNVKRALKMGKLFGEQPPQDLYHTRRSPSIAIPGAPPKSASLVHDIASAPATPLRRTPAAIDKSAYKRKTNKSNRPGTADSNTGLLLKVTQQEAGTSTADALSDVYKHYRHSLNSLTDILDRDDKESLAQLHEYLNPESYSDASLDSPDADPVPTKTKTTTTATTSAALRAERRRSLPSRPSISSLASEFTISPEHDRYSSRDSQPSAFQQRRRRAAKLSHFFGVNHRDLFGKVLDSLESGVKEDGGRGRLRPDEVNDLLHKLRKLKSRRDELSV